MLRNPKYVDQVLANYNKYWNHVKFTGIMHNDNLFEADQDSLREAKNVYVDENNMLISREPLLKEELPITTPVNFELIDIVTAGRIRTYVYQDSSGYYITAWDGATEHTIGPFNNYHISVVDHYIIAFNDKVGVGAQVLDVNKYEDGWKSLNEFVEVPVISRTVGSVTTELPSNEFTTSTKEEIILSNTSSPIIPTDREPDSIVVKTSTGDITWTIPNINTFTFSRILREISRELQVGDIFSAIGNRVCIARTDNMLLSLDSGNTFQIVWYPVIGAFLNIAQISADGQYVFVVGSAGAYRYNIGLATWTFFAVVDHVNPDGQEVRGTGVRNCGYFSNGEVFSFVTWDGTRTYRYNKFSSSALLGPIPIDPDMPYLPDVDISVNDNKIQRDCDKYRILRTFHAQPAEPLPPTPPNVVLFRSTKNQFTEELIWAALPSNNGNDTLIFVWTPNNIMSLYAQWQGDYGYIPSEGYATLNYRYAVILSSEQEVTTEPSAPGRTPMQIKVTVHGLCSNDGITWYNWSCSHGVAYKILDAPLAPGLGTSGDAYWAWAYTTPVVGTQVTNVTGGAVGLPFGLSSLVLQDLTLSNQRDQVPLIQANLPNEITDRYETWVSGGYYYMRVGDKVYTNSLLDTDLVVLTYINNSGDVFLKVPNLSYTDSELWLAMPGDDNVGNLLQITANIRDGTNIKFNLPSINNHLFISGITAMLNISTSEVAIFFEDRIVVGARVTDEVFGYRYDYHNTRLSIGVRLGDTVMNTLEGAHTIFPTRRGLAIMNYQAYMATTDQVLEFVTTNIVDIWKDFYTQSEKLGTTIFMLQKRNYLYISNGTNFFLMLDFRTNSWWTFEIPVNIRKFITDQVDLRVISNTLYLFSEEYERYRDFDNSHIAWVVMSQAYHFKLPNHWKNMKQLVFQLKDATGDPTKRQTMVAQIKLYRKSITIRPPELVRFNIDEYRTFVKRFNYWKINELQWALSNDAETVSPSQLQLEGVGVKYEISEEVRS